MLCAAGIHRQEAVTVGNVTGVGVLGQPLGGQIATIVTLTCFAFRIDSSVGNKRAATTAHNHIDPFAVIEVQHLGGNIFTAVADGFGWQVAVRFPVAIRHMGISGRRGRVSDTCR